MIRNGVPSLLLAPMEGVTDGPMRALLTESRAFTHCVAEFLRVSENIPPSWIFEDHVEELKNQSRTPSGVPVIFQILGGDAEKLAKTAALAVQMGAIGIDLNFGCPAATVNRHDGGATLLKYPHRIYEIVKTVRAAVPTEISVSAKLRLGWECIDDIYENAAMAVKGGATYLTVHGRTKVAGYKPPAYWGPIGELRKNLNVPVVANGEIWNLDDFKKCRDKTGCEHFMLGRGAIANPHLPWQVARELGLPFDELSEFPDEKKWKIYLSKLVQLSSAKSTKENYALSRTKQWLKAINSRTTFPLYDQVKVLKSIEELRFFL